jgi:hypothetical protein
MLSMAQRDLQLLAHALVAEAAVGFFVRRGRRAGGRGHKPGFRAAQVLTVACCHPAVVEVHQSA